MKTRYSSSLLSTDSKEGQERWGTLESRIQKHTPPSFRLESLSDAAPACFQKSFACSLAGLNVNELKKKK